MRIRIVAATSVADGAGRRFTNGQTPEVPEELAASWIAAGHAEPYTAKRASFGKGGRQQATRAPARNTAKKAAGATSSTEPPGDTGQAAAAGDSPPGDN